MIFLKIGPLGNRQTWFTILQPQNITTSLTKILYCLVITQWFTRVAKNSVQLIGL